MENRAIKICALIIAVLMTAGVFVCGSAAGGGAVAVKAAVSDILPGDRFVIVNDAGMNAVSKYSAGKRLSKAAVSFSGISLTYISDEAAVFTYEYADGGDVLLLCEQGYLTSSETGNGLFYTDTPSEFSVWRFEDGCYLYNVNSAYTSGGKEYKNNYLEYYPKSDFYSTYGKSGDTSLYKMSFYKLTDSAATPSESGYKLPVFETSDIHGYIVDTSSAEYEYRAAYISGRVNAKRLDNGVYRADKTLLIDGGDIYQGNPVSNLLHGSSVSAVFDLMKYDAVTIGNHEFDWELSYITDNDATMPDYVLNGKKYENKIPTVVCNIYKDGEKVPFASDYVIVEKTAENGAGNGLSVKVAVIGFALDYSSSIMYSKFSGAGYTVSVDYSAVNSLAKQLESDGLCDATVLLCHGEAAEAARGLGGNTAIDLVFGGHTHQSVCGKTASGLQYVQPAGQGEAYAYAELVFETDGEGKPVFSKVNAAQALSAASPELLYKNGIYAGGLDSGVVELTDLYLSDIKQVLDAEIGYITVSAQKSTYIDGSGGRATTSGNWLSSVTVRAVGADVGFINSGGIRADFYVPDGTDRRIITLSDVYTMFPFENKIYCFELSYPEFLTLLQYSLTKSGSTLLSYMYGVDCYYSGASVNAIVRDGVVMFKDGKWQNKAENKTIKVAVSEFIATSDRVSDGLSNPLCSWKDTDRLVGKYVTDCDGALDVLKGEAEKSGGLLYIDTKPHYISGNFTDEIIPLSPTSDGEANDVERDVKDESENVKNETLSRFLPLIIEAAALVFAAAAITVICIIIKRREKK